MRKSSIGGRPSISGAPLRIRNERLSAASRERSAIPKLQGAANQRKSTSSATFVPKAGRPSSGIGVRGRTDIPKDSRPISDKRYQNQCIKQLLEFLMVNKYPHPISEKLLVSPSSKDFFKIFEFIYSKFAPGYKQVPKMEDEVPQVLKMLGYPFALSKTYLFSVGSPHTWPHLLAALTWMIDILGMVDSINDHGGIDAFIFEPTDDDFDGISDDKIIFDYCEKTYAAFMSGADTFEEHDEALEKILTQKYQGGNIEDIIAENARLDAEVGFLEQSEDRLRKLKENITLVQHDKKAIHTFIENMHQYNKAQEAEVLKRKEEVDVLKSDLQSEREKLSHMQELFERQELTPAAVERFNCELESLKHQHSQLEEAIANINGDSWNISMELAKVNEKAETAVATYNRLAIALKLVPESAELANGKDFRLRTGFNSNSANDFEQNVKPMLTLMKKRCNDEFRRKNKEKFQRALELEQLQETVSEKKQKLAQMEKDLTSHESKLESMKQSFYSGKKTESDEIETLQQDISHLDIRCKQAEAKKPKLLEEYDTLCKQLSSKKDSGQKEIADLEEVHEKGKEIIYEHMDGLRRQLQGFLRRLDAVNAELDNKLAQTQEESKQRAEWLSTIAGQ